MIRHPDGPCCRCGKGGLYRMVNGRPACLCDRHWHPHMVKQAEAMRKRLGVSSAYARELERDRQNYRKRKECRSTPAPATPAVTPTTPSP